MSDAPQPQRGQAEASLHAELKQLAEKAWREHGIRLDHVYVTWQDYSHLEGTRLDITSVQITCRTYAHPSR